MTNLDNNLQFYNAVRACIRSAGALSELVETTVVSKDLCSGGSEARHGCLGHERSTEGANKQAIPSPGLFYFGTELAF